MNIGQREIFDNEEETIIEMAIMVSKKERIMKSKIMMLISKYKLFQ